MEERPRFVWLKVILPLLFMVGLNILPEPWDLLEHLSIARLAQKEGQVRVAAVHMEAVMAYRPWQIELWEKIGTDQLSSGNADEGILALKKAAALGALSDAGYRALGAAYEKVGQMQDALSVMEYLAQHKQSTSQDFAQQVDLLRKNGNYPEAIQTLQEWQTQYPQSSPAAYQLGLLLWSSNPDEALKQLEQAANLDAKYRGAADLFQKVNGLSVLNKDPGYHLTLYGQALANLGEWDLAGEAFKQATQASPNYAEAWAFLGEAEMQTGGDGLASVRRALSLNPKSVLANAVQSMYWSRQGKWDDAITFMQAAAALEPERAAWQMELGSLTAQKGDLLQAMAYYQKATALEPNNVQTWQQLASFSLRYHTGVQATGLPAARQAVNLDPNNPQSLDIIGSILMELSDYAGAERFFLQALGKDDSLAAVHLHLGELYIQTQDNQKAEEQLTLAASLDANSDSGKMAQRLLERYFVTNGGEAKP